MVQLGAQSHGLIQELKLYEEANARSAKDLREVLAGVRKWMLSTHSLHKDIKAAKGSWPAGEEEPPLDAGLSWDIDAAEKLMTILSFAAFNERGGTARGPVDDSAHDSWPHSLQQPKAKVAAPPPWPPAPSPSL